MTELIYRIIINPVIIIIAHIMAIFKPRVREGLDQRKRVLSNIEKWINDNPGNSKRIIFHTASLGEFEHIKPLLTEIKQRHQTLNIVSFFSASGYDNANLNPGMDLRTYVPIESFKNWSRFYRLIQPSILVVAKHDVWPAQIWAAKRLNIPTYLINASLSESSTRTNVLVRKFLSNVYSVIDKIFTISEEDTQRFESVYRISNVEFLGDTKYDQVVYRKRMAESQQLLPAEWKQSSHCVVCGSIWPEDTEHLFPALKEILEKNRDWKIILVPHEPYKKYVNDINNQFSQWGTIKFSGRHNMGDERVLIVDEIGHLAGLYHYADIAYVGGSFKQGIHNSMEPAIFGVPVLYGPVHKNSYEAIQLARQNGGMVVHNKKEIIETLSDLICDDDKRHDLGEKALHFASANTGATERLLDQWEKILTDNQ